MTDDSKPYRLALGVSACVLLTAAFSVLEMWVRDGSMTPAAFGYRNVYMLNMNLVPILLGGIIGYFRPRDWPSVALSCAIVGASLLVVNAVYLGTGMAVGSQTVSRMVDKYGYLFVFRGTYIKAPYALIGLAAGAGFGSIGPGAPQVQAEQKSVVSAHPYLFGLGLAMLLAIAAILIRNVFSMILFSIAPLSFGVLVGRFQVVRWIDVLYESIKVLALSALGIVIYVFGGTLILGGGGHPGPGIILFMLPMILLSMTPFVVAGIIAGWRMWR